MSSYKYKERKIKQSVMLTGEIKSLYADLVSLRITTGLFKSTGKCISFTAWAESCFFHSTCKHESKQGIISGMHFKDLTESYAQKQTQHRSGHCWQNILHFVLKFTSGTASLRGIWKKNGAVWASLSKSRLFSTVFVCTIEVHINQNLQGCFQVWPCI